MKVENINQNSNGTSHSKKGNKTQPGIPNDPSCCVVVDSGFSFSHIVPICNHRAIAEGIVRVDVGGKVLTNHMKEVISYRQLMVMEETYVVNTLKEDICFVSQDMIYDLNLSK